MNKLTKSTVLAGMLGASTIAMTMAMSTSAFAQETMASINGQVVDASSQPISGAAVTIIHVPSGTTKTATTSANGIFRSSGLRIGGPYTITVVSNNGNIVKENVRLIPASNSIKLSVTPVSDEIIVLGTRAALQDTGNGVGSVFSADDIGSHPAVNRDLIATLTRDPLANSTGEGILSVAGINPRFNALSIDGSLQQDDFGLSDSTYATARSPISLDIVESASVIATSYSVTSSGVSGGLVNVVTKSGTNEFNGSLSYYKQSENNFGSRAFDRDIETAPFSEKEYGAVLSGPIIKDKLFFLANYEKFSSGSGSNFTESDARNNVNPALYAGINQIVQDTYGFDLGGRPTVVSLPVISERYFGKLDWNINDNHRASVSYQRTEEDGVSNVRANNFQSAYYSTPTTVDSYSGQFFSDWTDNLSTHFRVNYKENTRGQNCNAGIDVGEFDIRLSEADLVGTAFEGFLDDGDANTAETGDVLFLTGGCDRFRQGNSFADSRLQIYGAANYTTGDHYITFGGEYQTYDLDNLFAQRSSGEFRFTSIADLENQFANRVETILPDSGNREDVRAVWGFDTLALFVQDSWQIRPDFRLDYGVRYETIIQSDAPQERGFFNTAYGFSNTQNLDGLSLFMPRLSFEYTPFDRTKVTGGVGLTPSGNAQVWVSNAFTPPVFRAREFSVVGADPTAGLPPSLLSAIQANDANDPGPIDVISPDFKTPSDWKASLRIDQELDLKFGGLNLGDDYNISLQALYSATNNGFRWENLAQTQLATTSVLGVAPDGRPIYANLDDLDIDNAIALTNFTAGSSLTLTASIDKEFDSGFGFFLSYANQNIETVTPGTSSRGVSNFQAIVDSDRNNPSAARSPFEIEHSFKLNLSYRKEFIPGLESRFSLFGQVNSGRPFSYAFNTFRNNNNALFGAPGSGESSRGTDLVYIPLISGDSIIDPNVVVGAGFDETAFIDFVNARGLEQGIQKRNSDRGPWNQRWDFNFQQELPFFNSKLEKYVGENRLKFVVNVQNIANLINSDWGTQFNSPSFPASIVSADIVTAADVAANGVDGATALTGDAPRTACVSADSCVYRFTDFRDRDAGFRSLNRSVYEIRAGLRFEF